MSFPIVVFQVNVNDQRSQQSSTDHFQLKRGAIHKISMPTRIDVSAMNDLELTPSNQPHPKFLLDFSTKNGLLNTILLKGIAF
jgi:hypothetical protein